MSTAADFVRAVRARQTPTRSECLAAADALEFAARPPAEQWEPDAARYTPPLAAQFSPGRLPAPTGWRHGQGKL